MKTAGYFDYFGEGRIGISAGVPRSLKGRFPVYSKLAPKRWMLGLSYDDYKEKYYEVVLGLLDAKRVVKELYTINRGVEPVLMCWEKLPLTKENWCHRTMVSQWLAKERGIIVSEIGQEVVETFGNGEEAKKAKQLALF